MPRRTSAKSRRLDRPAARTPSRWLDHTDVLRLLAFAARRDIELDALALVERAVPTALDIREVDEDILALLS